MNVWAKSTFCRPLPLERSTLVFFRFFFFCEIFSPFLLSSCRHFAVLAGSDDKSDLPWAMRERQGEEREMEEGEEVKEVALV